MPFDATDLMLSAIQALTPLLPEIKLSDADLANQIRRAAQSAALNLEEGCWKSGKDRVNRYRIAAGSASEVRIALRIAKASGYVKEGSIDEAVSYLGRVLAILWKIIDPLRTVQGAGAGADRRTKGDRNE